MSPAPSDDFEALGDTGWYPPDTNGAVGPDHLMVALNGGVSTMDKAGGARVVADQVEMAAAVVALLGSEAARRSMADAAEAVRKKSAPDGAALVRDVLALMEAGS